MKFNRYALSDLATIKYGKNQKKFFQKVETFLSIVLVD